jgi:protein-L-isoaspartate(D-aspartate) O-methyltransferase
MCAVCLLVFAGIAAVAITGDMWPRSAGTSQAESPQARAPGRPLDEGQWERARRQMVERDLAGRDITDRRVLEVMGRVPRHRFVPEHLQPQAYADHPLPIGHDQTISQPYIVALMTQLAEPKPDGRALDVGTGSGYQAAVLAELCKEVYSIEIVEPLADEAARRLKELGYDNLTVRHGDGYQGWPEKAPFDVIIVAAAPDHVPQPLVDQLAPGGKLVLPVGDFWQELVVIAKDRDGKVRREPGIAVRFVPMTGEARKRR